MGIKLSITNLVEASAASVLASHQTSNYCSTEAQTPQRPFIPWRTSTTTSSADLIVDLGSSQTVGLVALLNANFTCARIQGASSSGGLFAAPPYDETVQLARNPWTGRYQHTHLTTGFGYRYLRLRIPSQEPTDGVFYYELGGIWAGTLSTTPKGWRWDVGAERLEPKIDVAPQHGGWRQRSQMGDPLLRLQATLLAGVLTASPASGDDLDDTLDLQRQLWDADYFFCYLTTGDVSQGYVMRSADDPLWTVGPGLAETPWTLEEVVR